MNAFVRHHAPAIAFSYSCFDRLLLHGYIRALQFGGGVVSFLRHYRQAKFVSPSYLRLISSNYHRWLEDEVRHTGLVVAEPPPGVRRHDWVEPYYRRLGEQPGVAVLLKCRERARVAVCYPSRDYLIEPAWRCVNLYYFYLQDEHLGRFFLRLCPYFPFDVQVCLNGHEWLACQLRRQGIAFRKHDNAFVACDDPERLQQLADAFGPEHMLAAVEPCLARWLPYFSAAERALGYRHRLFVAQAEYCCNLVFHRAGPAVRPPAGQQPRHRPPPEAGGHLRPPALPPGHAHGADHGEDHHAEDAGAEHRLPEHVAEAVRQGPHPAAH
jgi:hypothetical protein